MKTKEQIEAEIKKLEELRAIHETDKPIHDLVNHPSHYTHGKIEVIDAIEDWQLNYHLGQVVKYVARAEYKGEPIQDLQKARWYLDREIQRRIEK